MSLSLSTRAKNTPPSPIRKLAHLAREAEARGTKVFYLNIGQPDIVTPREFFEGVREWKDKIVSYERSDGNQRLKSAWSAYMNASLSLVTKPDDFLITTGASEALGFLFMACCDPGDEILVLDPTYANYLGFASMTGVNLIPIETRIEENFAVPTTEVIERKITGRTKALLLCSPNNPTGTVYSKEELQKALALCARHNLFLIVDETYREFVYDGASPISILHVAANDERVVVVDSLSKRFSLCGARIGCLNSKNRELMNACHTLASARLSSPSLEQFASAVMLERISPTFMENVRKEYEVRRDSLFQALKKIPDVVAHKPQGAFYAIVKLPVEDAEQFARYMLTEYGRTKSTTFVAPASGFFMNPWAGKDMVRIAYVLESADIAQAMENLHDALQQYGS
jgi:aspartate aminotransferase